GKLALDEFGQAAERFEGRCADLVVGHRDAEMLLERRDEVDDRDRVELGNGAEQGRGGVHLLDARADLQRASHDLLHIIEQHVLVLGRTWPAGICIRTPGMSKYNMA